MEQLMTIDDIEREFDSEWVLLKDPQVNEKLEVLGGTVVSHSKNRDEVYREAADLRLKHSAFLYTGAVREDEEIVL